MCHQLLISEVHVPVMAPPYITNMQLRLQRTWCCSTWTEHLIPSDCTKCWQADFGILATNNNLPGGPRNMSVKAVALRFKLRHVPVHRHIRYCDVSEKMRSLRQQRSASGVSTWYEHPCTAEPMQNTSCCVSTNLKLIPSLLKSGIFWQVPCSSSLSFLAALRTCGVLIDRLKVMSAHSCTTR